MKKILVADDYPGILEMMEHFFSTRGYEVFCTKTVKDGIEISLNKRPGVIILDLELPDSPGEELLRIVKKNLPQTKVLVLSASDDWDRIDNLTNLNADGFIAKFSCSLLDIKSKVDALFELSHN